MTLKNKDLSCEQTTVSGAVYIDRKNGNIDCPGVTITEVDSVPDPQPVPEGPSREITIPEMPADAESIHLDSEDTTRTLTAGTYDLSALSIDEGTLRLDTSDGPIELWYNENDDIALDGTVIIDDRGTGNSVSLYVDQSSVTVGSDDGAVQTVPPERPGLFEIYLAGQEDVDIESDENFTGILYASDSNHDFDIQMTVVGAVYTGSNSEVDADPDAVDAVRVPGASPESGSSQTVYVTVTDYKLENG